MRWDIFCKVIDNHGDLGVCWRLAAELAARGEAVRLWIDEPSALAWMAPQGHPGVEVVHWVTGAPAGGPPAEPGDVVVEAFGCDPHDAFVQAIADKARREGHPPAWINLEYLSAESYVERCHGLPSPVMSGPARGLAKRFFYPGFTQRTGGLIREQDYDDRRAAFDADARAAFLARLGVPAKGEQRVSLFCYEPATLPQLLRHLASQPTPARLLVTAGRARAAVEAALATMGRQARPAITFLPLLAQPDYDRLLWSCDLNFVRGEDSLVRALWARRPFVWQIYPQDDGAHHAKLRAFLDWLQAPESLRAFHEGWNGQSASLPAPDLPQWQDHVDAMQARLGALPDLVEALRRAAADLHPAL